MKQKNGHIKGTFSRLNKDHVIVSLMKTSIHAWQRLNSEMIQVVRRRVKALYFVFVLFFRAVCG